MSRFSRPVSPALLIVLVVQLLLFSGTAYAALVVTGAQVKNGSLTGKDIKNDSLTGLDIREGTLKKVPAAASADSLGGVVVRRIRMIGTAPMAERVILTLRSLTLRASCDGSGHVTVTATTTSADAEISWFKHDASTPDANLNEEQLNLDDFPSGSTFTLTDGDHSDSIGFLRYVASNGDVVNVDLTEEDGFQAGSNNATCVLTGYATG